MKLYELEFKKKTIHKISSSHIELLLLFLMFIFIWFTICKFTCYFNFSGKQYKDEAFLELPKDWTEGLNIKKKVGHKAQMSSFF